MDKYPNMFFMEFNNRRKMRGADAARFEVFYSDNESELLWMSKTDIRKNMKTFPHCVGELLRGLAAYC